MKIAIRILPNASAFRILFILLLLANIACDITDSETSEPPEISWKQIGEFDNHRIHSVESSPDGQIYAVISDSIVVVSFNRGLTWRTRKNGLPDQDIRGLTINANGHLFTSQVDTLFRSMDGALSWERVLEGTDFSHAFSPILAAEENKIFLGLCCTGGMMRSLDNGSSWTFLKNAPLTGYVYHSLFMTRRGYLLAGSDFGLFESSDDGNSWSLISDLEDVAIIAIGEGPRGEIYVGGNSQESHGVVFRSDDDGQNWQQVSDLGEWIYDLAINANRNVFVAMSRGVSRSIDRGKTWEKLDSEILEIRVHALSIDEAGYVYAGSDGAGLFRSSEPTTY